MAGFKNNVYSFHLHNNTSQLRLLVKTVELLVAFEGALVFV